VHNERWRKPACANYGRSDGLALLRAMRAEQRGGAGWAVNGRGNMGGDVKCMYVVGRESADEIELAIPYVVCAQLYVCHRALRFDNPPDDQNASVTVSRVVRGVTVYPLSQGA